MELRVVTSPSVFKGVGPVVIKHIFTLGMSFEIHRHCTNQFMIVILQQQMLGEPSGLSRAGATFLEGMKESIREKRVGGTGTSIPLPLIHFRQARDGSGSKSVTGSGITLRN